MLTPIEHAIQNAGGPERFLAGLERAEKDLLLYQWQLWARPEQLPPPGEWVTWLILAGRGWGKTRTGAEWIRQRVTSGAARHIALVGRTPGDVRDVMIEGESGILNVFPPGHCPVWEPSRRRLTFSTGAIATTYSSENPDQLRGPQQDTAWCDEVATFKSATAWDNLQLGLRLRQPQQIVTTTPRTVHTVRELVKDAQASGATVMTQGATYQNRAHLAPAFFAKIIARYEGTRLGEQEIKGLLLADTPGALWARTMITYHPGGADALPAMRRVVIGVDPSVSDGEDAAECGIIAVGHGVDDCYYVLADYSLRASPNRWAVQVVRALRDWEADRIVAETNQGGAMVEGTLRTVERTIPYRGVHASVGKQARAEPISSLYEQDRVRHVAPLVDLEDQLCTWVAGEGESPDRLDALVWAMTELTRPQAGPMHVGIA